MTVSARARPSWRTPAVSSRASPKRSATGLAAIQIDGKFVDYPIVYLAQRLVARAQAIEEAGQRR